jgi:hypothetical protein
MAIYVCNPALERLKSEDIDFMASMIYIERPCLRSKNNLKIDA